MWDFLFPVSCLGCGLQGTYLCSSCLASLPPGSSFSLRNLSLVSATSYGHPLVKKMIWEYKYGFVKELAKPLASLMVKHLKGSVLVPVPLHLRRLRWRGFNQSLLLAQETGLPVADCLVRVRNTSPQMKIKNSLKREQNIQDAFRLKYLPSGEIILIDDVCTTGSTLEACAALFERPVRGLVVAHG